MNKRQKHQKTCISTLHLFIIALIICIFVITFSYTFSWGSYQNQLEAQSSNPAFSVMDVETFDGGRFNAENLHGTKLTAFNVWETTCSPCLGEMPNLEKISNMYDKADFQLVGVCSDLYGQDGKLSPEKLKEAKQLMKDAGTTFPHLIPDQKLKEYLDICVSAYPTTFFVDKDGTLLTTTAGAKDLNEWKEFIEQQMESLE